MVLSFSSASHVESFARESTGVSPSNISDNVGQRKFHLPICQPPIGVKKQTIPSRVIVTQIHIAILCSSFFVKRHIVNVDNSIKDKTNFIKLLKVDVDVIAETTDDPEVREAFVALSEQVRYSDPMSHESLFELEKQIQESLIYAKRCVDQGKNEAALKNCESASRMLFERNEKTKALK